jgi:hypothetical protein
VVNAASVCADSTDFAVDTDNGRLKLNPHFAQSNPQAFIFVLDGDQDTFEKVTSFDDVSVPVDGYYTLTADAHGNATITSAAPGTTVNAQVSFQVRRNNSPIAGTETILMLNSQGSSTVDQPALQLHGSGSCTRAVFLSTGDAISIWAKRNSDLGTTTDIRSDTQGRCRLTLVRFGGL